MAYRSTSSYRDSAHATDRQLTASHRTSFSPPVNRKTSATQIEAIDSYDSAAPPHCPHLIPDARGIFVPELRCHCGQIRLCLSSFSSSNFAVALAAPSHARLAALVKSRLFPTVPSNRPGSDRRSSIPASFSYVPCRHQDIVLVEVTRVPVLVVCISCALGRSFVSVSCCAMLRTYTMCAQRACCAFPCSWLLYEMRLLSLISCGDCLVQDTKTTIEILHIF
jgi:hypothetical protein